LPNDCVDLAGLSYHLWLECDVNIEEIPTSWCKTEPKNSSSIWLWP